MAQYWSQTQRACLDLDGLPGGLCAGLQLELVGQAVTASPPPALLKYKCSISKHLRMQIVVFDLEVTGRVDLLKDCLR